MQDKQLFNPVRINFVTTGVVNEVTEIRSYLLCASFFNLKLHTRDGGSFPIEANRPYRKTPVDSPLLEELVKRLPITETGITKMRVRYNGLWVYHYYKPKDKSALDETAEIIRTATTDMGVKFVEVNIEISEAPEASED